MHSEMGEHMERIHSKVQIEKSMLSDLKAQLASNTDRYVNQLLRQASNWLNEVEVLYLGILKDERFPPRTLAEETRILDQADFLLEKVTIPQLRTIQEMVTQFGLSVQSSNG